MILNYLQASHRLSEERLLTLVSPERGNERHRQLRGKSYPGRTPPDEFRILWPVKPGHYEYLKVSDTHKE